MSYTDVKAFAKIKNISIDEAKKELKKKQYESYIKVVNGRILIDYDFIQDLKKNNSNTNENKQETKCNEQEIKYTDTLLPLVSNDEKEIERLTNIIEALKKEVANKEIELKKTADRLEQVTNSLIESNRAITDLSIKFAEATTQAQQIASQAQYLQLADKKEKTGFFKKLFIKKEQG